MDRGGALQLQLKEPKEQRVPQRGLRAQARKSEPKSSPGPAILLDLARQSFFFFFFFFLAFREFQVSDFSFCFLNEFLHKRSTDV